MRKQLFLMAVLGLAGVSRPAAQAQQPLAITSLVPASTPAGSADFTLDVLGTGFRSPAFCGGDVVIPVPQSLIVWNDTEQPATTFNSTTNIPNLSVTIPASYVTSQGTAAVKVRNRSCTTSTQTLACTCTNVGDSNVLNFTISPPLAAGCNNPPPGLPGASYSHTLAASGGVSPYMWTSQTMPSGLTLASNGTISGVIPAGATGQLSFSATLWDSTETSRTISCSIPIGPPLAASCNNPPQATAGVPYSHRLIAGGGVPPYVWTPTLIAPQVSLAADGSISGGFTGTDVPGVSFTAAVRDSLQQMTRISCQILVSPPPVPSIMDYNPREATACGPGFTLSVLGSNFLPGIRMGLGTSTANLQALATTYMSQSALSASVLREQIMTPGMLNLWAANQVTTATPFVWSDPRPFLIRRTPRVVSLTPSRANIGSADLPVSVTGTDFLSGVTRVVWQSGAAAEPLTVTRWSDTELGVVIPQRLLAAAARAQIRVVNVEPANPGGTAYLDTCSPPVVFSVDTAALAIDTAQLPPGKLGVDYQAALSASGGTRPYRFTLVSGSVPGLSLSADGVLSGRPSQVGSYPIRIQAGDASSPPQTVQRDFTLVVNPTDLVITAPGDLPDGIVGSDYSVAFSATGGTPPYRWEVLSESPAATGLTLSAAGVLSGRPQRAGLFTFQVQVTDSSPSPLRAQRTYATTITLSNLAIAAPYSLPNASAGAAYSAMFTATGGTPPYSWELLSETPGPTGLVLSPAGVLSGKPQQAGSFTLRIQVTDNATAPLRTQRDFSLTVDAARLAISAPAALPAGTIGAAYSVVFTATGGRAPYEWSLASGSIPGVSLASDGTLSGTPARDGSFPVSVHVTDADAQQATRNYSMQIGLPGATAILTAPAQPGSPTDQPVVTMRLGTAYPMAMQGRLGITFAPNASGVPAGYMDPALQFASGGTTLGFTIPADSTSVPLPQNGAIQLGSVAGTITVAVQQLRSGSGTDVPLSSRPSAEITVPRLAPVIIANSVQITGLTSGGFAVELDGYSTPRDLRSATFTFSAASGSQLDGQSAHTLQLSTESAAWFATDAGRANGSRFHLRVPFTLTGAANALGSVSVRLDNSVGTSNAVSGGVR